MRDVVDLFIRNAGEGIFILPPVDWIDIFHYQKIIVALVETAKLMIKVDAASLPH